MTVLLRLATSDEAAVGALWALGAAAVIEEGSSLLAGFADDAASRAAASELAPRYPTELVAVDGAPDPTWTAHLRPVRTHRLVVTTPAAAATTGRTAARRMVIDPTAAFGHGGHPSTALALEALDRLVTGRERVLDVGTGTGVLAIAAVVLGAAAAVAVDIDPVARAAASANADRNDVAGRVEVVEAATGDGYDLIVANVPVDVHERLGPDLIARLAPTGTLLVSGILDGQMDRVQVAYRPLRGVGRYARSGWVLLALTPATGR